MRAQGFIVGALVIASIGFGFWYWLHFTPPQVQEIITPGPLRGSLARPAGKLTVEGMARETNKHRQQVGLPALTANAKLAAAAQAKLNDMFARRYFEHVGPDDKGPSDWVGGAGYTYLRVGENLALGNFASDAELVQAWMDSPGHRANILSPGFTEIGIAVKSGTFEDKQTWLAVQEFGLPASTCPAPNAAAQKNFTAQTEEANQRSGELERERAELEAQREEVDTPEEQAAYNRRVKDYNRQIEELRQLEADLQELVTQINQQIKQYNACLAKFSR